jgi:hypothetical protein
MDHDTAGKALTTRKRAPGAGRPHTGKVRHTVTLLPEQWAHIEGQIGRNRSERLAAVVQRDMEASSGDTVIIDSPPPYKRIVIFGIVGAEKLSERNTR